MSKVIKNQIVDEIKSACLFALQPNKSTNVSSCSQLISFICYIHNSAFKDEFLWILDLPSRTHEKIFFRANDIEWELLCSLYTDDALPMLGYTLEFHAQVKKVSSDCTFMHCMIHHETLASKTLG